MGHNLKLLIQNVIKEFLVESLCTMHIKVVPSIKDGKNIKEIYCMINCIIVCLSRPNIEHLQSDIGLYNIYSVLTCCLDLMYNTSSQI